MIHYYLMIAAETIIDGSAKFYKIGVGDTKRDRAALAKLKEFADAKGYYFSLYNQDTAEFLYKIAQSLGVQVYLLPSMRCSVQVLSRLVINYNAAPELPATRQNLSYMRAAIDPNFYFTHKKSVIQKAESGTRYKPKAKCVSAQA